LERQTKDKSNTTREHKEQMTSEYYERMRRKRLEAKRKREILGNVQFEDDLGIYNSEDSNGDKKNE
jgi:hypothetical protein